MNLYFRRKVLLLLLLLVCFLECFVNATEGISHLIRSEGKQRVLKTTHDRIVEHNGYPAETYQIMTEDGYVIKIFRIPHSQKSQNKTDPRPIVLLQHGLMGSSDSWVLLGPNDGLPFLLADAGFDVWIGNSRGNVYARKHRNLSQFSTRFWQFSWHEIGYFDLPAIIDFILKKNRIDQKSLHYIGFSQGTTASLVMLSMRPEYNTKIKTAHLLAPVAYVRHLNDKLVKSLALMLGQTSSASMPMLSNREFLPQNEIFIHLSYNVCTNAMTKAMGLCSAIAFLLEKNLENVNRTALQYLAETHPAGCSTNQLIHYMQEQQSNCFCRFDFGDSENEVIYGQIKPPNYPLENITAKLHLWYGDNDDMAAVEDVERLASRLPNRIMHRIENPKWAHGDFLLNNQLRIYVNDPLIWNLRSFEEINEDSSRKIN